MAGQRGWLVFATSNSNHRPGKATSGGKQSLWLTLVVATASISFVQNLSAGVLW